MSALDDVVLNAQTYNSDLYRKAEAELAAYRESYRLLLLVRNEYPGTLLVTYENGSNVRDMTDELSAKIDGTPATGRKEQATK